MAARLLRDIYLVATHAKVIRVHTPPHPQKSSGMFKFTNISETPLYFGKFSNLPRQF